MKYDRKGWGGGSTLIDVILWEHAHIGIPF